MNRFYALSALCVGMLLLAPNSASAQDNPYLESVGALAAAQLYTTASYLDVTKEALVLKAFKAKDVRVALDRMGGMTDNVGKYLTKVVQTKITAEDQAFLQDAIAIYGLLKTEALALHRYAGTLKPADLEAFGVAREAAWARLKQLLKLP